MNLFNILSRIKHYKGHVRPFIKISLNNKIRKFNDTGLNTTPRSPKLIISLTSYEKRLKDIHYTLYSLLTQSIKPDKVILYLDKTKFNDTNSPQNVSRFFKNGLEVHYVEDIGSYTKLYPALNEFPNDIIVTADDDIYYEKDWLEKLYSSSNLLLTLSLI